MLLCLFTFTGKGRGGGKGDDFLRHYTNQPTLIWFHFADTPSVTHTVCLSVGYLYSLLGVLKLFFYYYSFRSHTHTDTKNVQNKKRTPLMTMMMMNKEMMKMKMMMIMIIIMRFEGCPSRPAEFESINFQGIYLFLDIFFRECRFGFDSATNKQTNKQIYEQTILISIISFSFFSISWICFVFVSS